jgi:eukaryotic-like serine/threonine-protein kinase
MTDRCNTCGSPLVPGADGVAQCPRCLLNLAFDLASEATEGDVTLDATSPASPARRLGPYRLVDILGEGGMGIVWRAEQLEPIRRAVAVKLVKPGLDSSHVLARFESERQALALLDHPGIAKVLDAGQAADGRPYFVMELVAGLPVTTYCDEHRLTVRERLELFTQICDAVQHAHQKGIIHRDLKPSNILVATVDDRPTAKIIDFGVAKATGERLTVKSLVTQQGLVLGTPEYMSPEQAGSGAEAVDTRTDVYSLGVLLYELLVGSRPFDVSSMREAAVAGMLRAIREDEPPKPTTRLASLGEVATEVAKRRKADRWSLARQVKGELEWIAMRALEKEPARRYASASELAADVKRHLADEAVLAGPPSAAYQMRKFVRRHRFGVSAAAIGLLALVGFAVTMTFQAERIKREAEAKRRVSEFVAQLFEASDSTEGKGQGVTAREFLDRGVTMIRGTLTEDPQVRSELMMTMGKVYRNLGLYAQAEPLLEQARETRLRSLGKNDPETLRLSKEIGKLYYLQGRFVEAEALHRETLEIQERVLGPEHPDTLSSMQSLAHAYFGQRRFKDAEDLYRKTLEIRQRLLGPEHPDTLESRMQIADVCSFQGRSTESETILLETLEIQKRVLGSEHSSTVAMMTRVGDFYFGEGHPERAEPLYREAFDTRKRLLGPAHPDTLESMTQLGDSLLAQRRFENARTLYVEVIEIKQRVLGTEHTDTLASMGNLATFYFFSGRLKEASALTSEILDIRKRVLGPDHQDTLDSMYDAAWLAAWLGHWPETLRYLREAVAHGYTHVNRLGEFDRAFHRTDPEFEKIVASAKENQGRSVGNRREGAEPPRHTFSLPMNVPPS